MNVFVGATSGAYCETYIYSINSSGEEVNLATINSNNTYSRTIEIPSDCVKMKFVSKAYAYFREIRLLD